MGKKSSFTFKKTEIMVMAQRSKHCEPDWHLNYQYSAGRNNFGLPRLTLFSHLLDPRGKNSESEMVFSEKEWFSGKQNCGMRPCLLVTTKECPKLWRNGHSVQNLLRLLVNARFPLRKYAHTRLSHIFWRALFVPEFFYTYSLPFPALYQAVPGCNAPMNMGKKKASLLFLFPLSSALDLEGSEEWLLQCESPPFLARGHPSVN